MCSVWRLRSRQQQKETNIFSSNSELFKWKLWAGNNFDWTNDELIFRRFFSSSSIVCILFDDWWKIAYRKKDRKMKSQYLKCELVDAWVVLNLGLNHHRELTIDCVRNFFLFVCELKRVNRYRSLNGRLRVNEENWPNRNVMFNKVQFTVINVRSHQDHEALNQ